MTQSLRASTGVVVGLFYLGLAVAVLALSPEFSGDVDNSLLSIYIALAAAAIVMHLLRSTDRNYLRMDVLFLLGFSIVHFQWPIMLAVSGKDLNLYTETLARNPAYINYGTWLSLMSLLSWFFGFWIHTPRNRPVREESVKFARLTYCCGALFLAFLAVAGGDFFTGEVYKKGGSADAVSGIAGYFYTVFHISVITLTVAVVYRDRKAFAVGLAYGLKRTSKLYLLVAGAYMLIFLFVGDRGGPLQLMFAVGLLYGVLVKPVDKSKFVLLIVAGALLMSLIGAFRGSGGDIKPVVPVEAASVYDATISLASSARTLYFAMNQVPATEDFFYGKLWLGNILGLIPFSQTAYIALSGEPAYVLNSAAYITFLRYGPNPHTGEGTSLVADIYLNAGVAGTLIMMFLLGLLTRHIQHRMQAGMTFNSVLIGTLFGCVMFYLGRATLFTPLQMVVWGYVMSWLFVTRRRVA